MRYRKGRARKTKRSSISSVVLLLCAAKAIPSRPQTLTTLVNFGGNGVYGSNPASPLIEGTDGNLYGTTGGITAFTNGGSGTIFKLTLAGTLTALHSFSGTDGAAPGLAVKKPDTFSGVTTVPAAPKTTPHNNGSSRISHRPGCRR